MVDRSLLVSTTLTTSTNEAGEEGVLLTGIVAGEEVTLFINTEDPDCTLEKATYTTAASSVDAQLSPVGGTINDTTFGKGDVLLYSLNAKGEAGKVAILVEASDVATSGAYGSYLDTIDGVTSGDTTIATVTVGTTTHRFVFGYATEFMANGNLTLTSAAGNAKTYTFAPDAVGAAYDAYTGTGKVYEAMNGDITTDSDANATSPFDGDVVFARATGSRINEFVVIANSR